MDERTRAATYQDVRRIAKLLEEEHVEYADVMNSASGFTWQQMLPYRTRIEGINVVSLEGLLRLKEHGRLKDRADAEAIRRALGAESSP